MKMIGLCVVGALCTGVAITAAAETTWYQKAAVTAGSSKALTDLSFWAADGSAGSGAPTADDNLIAYNNWRLRIAGATCPAKSLQLGTLTPSSTSSEVVHDGNPAIFQNDGLKLVKGGWWFNNGSGLTVGGPITVLSPKENAFGFFAGQEQYSSCVEVISGPISGAASSGLIFGKTGSWVSAPKTTFNLTGDLSGFEGTMYVRTAAKYQTLKGADYGTRVRLPASASPCTVEVEAGCALSAVSPQTTSTVARVSFAAGSRYEPAMTDWYTVTADTPLEETAQSAMSCLKVTESLTMAGPLEIYVNSVLRGAGLYRLPILMMPASSAFTVDDFKLVRGANFYNLDMHFEIDTDPETGLRTLYAVAWGFVYMNGNNYANEHARDNEFAAGSSLTNGAAWWDKRVPHAGSGYRLAGKYLRTPVTPKDDYAFPGEWLYLQNGSGLILAVKSFGVPALYTSGENAIGLSNGSLNNPVTLKADRFNFEGTVLLRAHDEHVLRLQGPIDGSAHLAMRGWSPTGSPKATYEFDGVNTNFTGTMSVSQDEYRDAYISFEVKFPTLLVNDGRNLGGCRAAFTPRALQLTRMARLSVTNDSTVTLADDLNRGVYVLEKGRLHAQTATTVLDVRQPILLSGHLWTEGNGTVVLGGAMSFEKTDGGEICDVPRAGSNLVTVASRVLQAADPDCLNGCDVTFEAGTKLVLDADRLGATGLRLTRSGTVFRLDGSFGGKLPVSVVTAQSEPADRSRETRIALVTVPDGEMVAAVRAMMPAKIARVWPHVAQRVVELHDAENGLTTFALSVQNRGFTCIIR